MRCREGDFPISDTDHLVSMSKIKLHEAIIVGGQIQPLTITSARAGGVSFDAFLARLSLSGFCTFNLGHHALNSSDIARGEKKPFLEGALYVNPTVQMFHQEITQ